MTGQLTFDLPLRVALGRADFLVAPSNALALAALDAWSGWPQRKLVLVGPAGSGKTHLAQVWAADTGARLVAARALVTMDPVPLCQQPLVVEDIDSLAGDQAAETALFHLHNLMAAQQQPLLLTARLSPGRAGFCLPDLASRLLASQSAVLEAPDDALLSAVLVKMFADRQVMVPPALIPWLVARMERSLSGAGSIVARLDAAALTAGKPISRAIAAEVLDRAEPPAT